MNYYRIYSCGPPNHCCYLINKKWVYGLPSLPVYKHPPAITSNKFNYIIVIINCFFSSIAINNASLSIIFVVLNKMIIILRNPKSCTVVKYLVLTASALICDDIPLEIRNDLSGKTVNHHGASVAVHARHNDRFLGADQAVNQSINVRIGAIT